MNSIKDQISSLNMREDLPQPGDALRENDEIRQRDDTI